MNEKFKILGGIICFAIVWMTFAVPALASSDFWQSLNPPIQYLSYNFGMIILISVIFGSVLTTVLKEEFSYKNITLNGIVFWAIFSGIIDNWQPMFYIDKLGNPITANPEALSGASVDGMLYYIFNTVFPQLKSIVIPVVDISAIYIVVYVLVPFLIILLAALLWTKGKFISFVKESFGGVLNAK